MVAGSVVAAMMVLPVVHLVVRALDAENPGDLLTGRVLDATTATLLLGFVVAAAASALGVASAFVLERTDVPGHRLLGVVACLPLVVPTYVLAVTLKDAFGPGALLVEVPGVVGFAGAGAVLALSTYPYVLLVVRAALAGADPAVEEAARSLGDGSGRVFRRVILPVARPALAAGALLVFLYVLSDFGAVSILRYPTLTMAIFTEYRSTFDRSAPALLGVVLVALTIAAIVTERLARGRAVIVRAVSGTRPAARHSLGRWRWPVAGLVLLPPVVSVAVPAAVLLFRASLSTGTADSAAVVIRAAGTSLVLSAGAALLCVVLSVPVSALAVRFRSRWSTLVEGAALAGFALPGLVIALALVFFAARYVPWLYQTPGLVVVAYVIRFFPEALGATRSSMATIDPALEEAGRALGDSRAAVLRRLTVPLVRPGIVAGAALVFLTAMKELPATLVLRPAGYDTLATRVWTGAAEGFYRQAAPSALLLLFVSGWALWPLVRRGARARPEVLA